MIAGPLLFARFAYPPNELGYCGPGDHAAVGEYAAAGVVDHGLVQLARRFSGAWPYLELIAAVGGIQDPLDARVVEAYWIGNRLLDRVGPAVMAGHLNDRFGRRLARDAGDVTGLALAGAVPHHNFHVFGVYPWLGLLRAGFDGRPLAVLDRCRVRWGRVVSVSVTTAVVSFRPIRWNGVVLSLGLVRDEEVRVEPGLGAALNAGDDVALHWDWICHRLDPPGLRTLRHYTRRMLAVVNAAARPAPVLT